MSEKFYWYTVGFFSFQFGVQTPICYPSTNPTVRKLLSVKNNVEN